MSVAEFDNTRTFHNGYDLALPVSHIFSEVIQEVFPRVTWLELRRVEDISLVHGLKKRLMMHFNAGTGFKNYHKYFPVDLLNKLNRAGVEIISLDIGPDVSKFKIDRLDDVDCPLYVPLEDEPRPDRHQLMSTCLENISWLKKRWNGQIFLENLNYYPSGAYDFCTDVDFILQVLEKSGCKLLFDIAHWEVTAYNLRLDPMEMISRIPKKNIGQIHVSQCGYHPSFAFDAHYPPLNWFNSDNARLYHGFLKKIPKLIWTIEYYENPATLVACYDGLTQYLNNN